MPVSITDIDISLDTAALPAATPITVALVGTATSSPPGANFGEANQYSSASTVGNDYGPNSDVAIASNVLDSNNVANWYVVVLEEQQVTGETLNDSTSGTLANAPILGDPEPSVGTGNVSYVAGTPDNTISSGVELNPDTSDYYNAETSNTIDYSYVDWSQLDKALTGLGVTLPYVADKQYGVKNVGTLDEIVQYASQNAAATVAAGINGANATDDTTAMGTYHDVFGYVPSGNLLAVAHKSTADVGAHIVAQAATEDPDFDVFYDGDGYGFNTGYYRNALVGEPGQAGTFEGGDAANNSGPVNVIINKAGVDVLSNSITTAGAASSYQFWDIKRTENYAKTLVQDALNSLRLSQDKIPFSKEGQTLISGAINSAFVGEVGGADAPFSEVNVTVPSPDSLPDNDVANRIFSGITVEATLAGNVHEFKLTMNIGV